MDYDTAKVFFDRFAAVDDGRVLRACWMAVQCGVAVDDAMTAYKVARLRMAGLTIDAEVSDRCAAFPSDKERRLVTDLMGVMK